MDKYKEIELKDNNNDGEVEIDLLELLSFYATKLRWILIGFFAGALIAGLITQFGITPKYTATAKMYMVNASSQSVVDLTDLNIGQNLSNDYVELLRTRPIIESVIEEQKLEYTYNQVVNMLGLSVIQDTRIVKIDVTSTDAREAMKIANALADKGVSELPRLMDTPEPHIAEYAIVPLNKSAPSLSKNTMVGALLGLLIMLVIFTIQFLSDDTFRTSEDIQKEFGIMPIAVIPEGHIEGFESDEEDKKSRKKDRRKRKKERKRKKS